MTLSDCQDVLVFLYNNKFDTSTERPNTEWVLTTLYKHFEIAITKQRFENIIAELYSKGYIRTFESRLPRFQPFHMIYFSISPTGISYLHSGGYLADLEKNKRDEETALLQLELLKSQKEFQALNNSFISKQSELIDSQKKVNDDVIKTNSHIVTNNRTTRIILWVTVSVTAINLIPASISVWHDFNKDTSEEIIKKQGRKIQLLETKSLRQEKMIDSLSRLKNLSKTSNN